MTQSDTSTPAPQSALKESLQKLAGTVTERAVSSATDRLSGASERLTDYAEGGGGKGLLAAVTGADKLASGESPTKAALSAGWAGIKEKATDALSNAKESLTGGKGKAAGKKLKLTNIVEDIDVGAPLELVYKQWTEFPQFPKFMKKVEQADQKDEKVQFRAKVFWSRRNWEASIIEQVPFDHIIWTSKGAKGHIDGAVSFHELTPTLTRIVVVLEYYPKGLFERTGNLWRAQGRRARLELKNFRRHVMTQTLLHPDDVEGWLGEIRDGEVVDTGETEDDTTMTESEEEEGTEEEGTEEPEDTEEPEEEEPEEPEEEDTEEPEPAPRKRASAERRSRRPIAAKGRMRT